MQTSLIASPRVRRAILDEFWPSWEEGLYTMTPAEWQSVWTSVTSVSDRVARRWRKSAIEISRERLADAA